MKAAHYGVRYDTDKADFVASYTASEYHTGQHDNDSPGLCFWSATLYRKPRTGHYFLCGRGDIMSVFRGRERIIPLSEAEAMAWLERYFD